MFGPEVFTVSHEHQYLQLHSEVKATTETQTAKTKFTALVPRKIANKPPKDAMKLPRRAKESLLRTKMEKPPSPPKALPTTSSLERASKPEDPEILKAKLGKDNRSEKYLKKKESRKQASLRTVLYEEEEKMHAKEAEMNQIQAITQEETEAKIKQLRKSLNFRATPMPSFYHEATAQGSDGKKVVSSHVKSTKWQRKSPSPGCTVADRSSLFSSAVSQQGVSTSEFENKAAQPQASEETDCPPTVASEVGESTSTASTNKHCTSKFVTRSDKREKKDIGKGKNSKHQGSKGSKLQKERFFEGRWVVGAVGSSGQLVRKAMKEELAA
ncbi:hypothetical protein NE237_007820 [Protea cynaroides]|uniref:TPX2 C-terminal domain-containing protein n=1 Tax=Protea cynaroides TaxID=273540 RepID=A0A9Q0KQY6_9MAGN|nr:hypothetical protein NE237_007820 [Protea cynaroides]